ncbi:cysteine hydrolase family protein [Microvirga pudoricolor]|uniref:cysteine hydrolase family protein n=1 Tax=Microvirga pudoricolor TaxID=2778729 RepID=UPI001950CC53|nr:cysteine hydrolase [Microvirga pudoricolor]MBM6595310.1 cysteine hydrolase [Microvirga pudoricolor]
MKIINGVSVRDTPEELVNPATTALVVVDVQNDFCHPEGHFARYKKDLSATQAAMPALVSFVTRVQDLGIRVVFIRQQTLPGGKSDSPAWLRFKCRDGKSPDYTLKDTWGAEFVDGLAPRQRDIVVEKYRPDAFVHTNLDQLLRANGIASLAILGTTTEGCVESTIRGGSYHDYYTVVVHDLITSPNKVLHEGSMRLFEARYPMMSSDELLGIWQRSSPAQAAE